jgi:hypothetical protein
MSRTGKQKSNPFSGIIQESGQARNKPVEQIGDSEKTTGRRSRSDYTQVAGYVPASLYRQVKKKLFDEERNFSELLEKWMTDYVAEQRVD